MQRFAFLLALASVGCGSVVAEEAVTPPVKEAAPIEWTETASCAEVQASCTEAPATFVRGHAEGLGGVDGARVEFGIRYILEEGRGLSVPHGVVVARARVKGSAFEACVCVPRGANMYPQIASIVYRPGTTGVVSAEVARATYSQRYATLGDEDVGYALKAVPSALQKEAAVAAMSDRVATVTLKNLGKVDGAHLVAGLVADDRPLAAQTASAEVAASTAAITWTMPGRASASERVAFFVDQNRNGKCDVDGSDIGGTAATTGDFSGKWVSGVELAPVCDALLAGASRE